MIANIFVLTGDIRGRVQVRRRAGRSERMQEPTGRREWGRRSRGGIRDGGGEMCGKTVAARRKMAAVKTDWGEAG